MNIPPVQVNMPADTGATSMLLAPSKPGPAPADSTPSPSSPAGLAPAPAASPFSTDMRVDSEHQIYYEFVDDSSGNVLFEIPPEALRAIGEGLTLPMNENLQGLNLDVKS